MAQENTSNGRKQSRKGINSLTSGFAKLNEKKVVIISICFVCALFSFMFWTLYEQNYTASVLIYPDQLSKSELIPGNNQAGTELASYNMPFEIYSTLLRSPDIQMQVLQKNYTVKFNYKSYSIDLTRYFAMKNISYALQELNEITEIDYLNNSHILQLSVTTRHPDLSRQIADAYLMELERRLNQLRHEKISSNNERLDEALQFIQNYKSISDSARSDFVGRLQSKKETVMMAAEINPIRLAAVNEGYTHKSLKYSRTAIASIPLILGFAAIIGMFVMESIKSQKKVQSAPVKSGRVSMKRKSETAPTRSKKRQAHRTTKKTTIEKKPQARRAVKV